jgi:hypothetical protein
LTIRPVLLRGSLVVSFVTFPVVSSEDENSHSEPKKPQLPGHLGTDPANRDREP